MKNMKYQPGGTRPRKKPRSLEETRFSLDSKKSQTGILTNQASCASGGLHLAGAAGSNSSSLLEAARRRVDFREVAAAAANSPLQSLMDLQLQQAILQQRFGHFPATNVLHQQQRLMNPSVLRSLALTQSNLGGSSNNLANSLSRMNPTLLSDRLMGNLAATNTFPTTTSRLGTGTAGGEGANTQLGSGLMTYLLQQEQAGLQPDPRIVEFLLEKDRGV